MKGRLAKLRRVQDLFTEGKVVFLERQDPNYQEPVAEPFWVSKPTAFERDEALKDARAARARRAIRFDTDPDEQEIVQGQLHAMTSDDVIDTLIGAKGNEHYIKALDELKADEDWAERIDVLDRAGLEDDRDSTVEDRAVMRTITTEYLAAIDELTKKYNAELREELAQLDGAELRKRYRETWRDMTAFEAFMETRRVTEIYFALRVCEGTRVDGEWSHVDCDHRERLLDKRDQVFDLPDALLQAVRATLEGLQMTPREAGNSDAPLTSSGSSEQPSEQEGSTGSGQEEMSPVLVGT